MKAKIPTVVSNSQIAKNYRHSWVWRFWPTYAFLMCPTTRSFAELMLLKLMFNYRPVGPPSASMMSFKAFGSFFMASFAFCWYLLPFQSFSVTSISWTVLLFMGSLGSLRVMRASCVRCQEFGKALPYSTKNKSNIEQLWVVATAKRLWTINMHKRRVRTIAEGIRKLTTSPKKAERHSPRTRVVASTIYLPYFCQPSLFRQAIEYSHGLASNCSLLQSEGQWRWCAHV